MPFFEGLESGVMRPVFLPDGSLLLGQTGRGWQAKGGKVASLQHVRWDGKTVAPAMTAMLATPKGFKLQFTQPLRQWRERGACASALALESWTYRDAPDYGSPELDLRNEAIALDHVECGSQERWTSRWHRRTMPKVHPRQTARVYHAKLAAQTLFDANAPAQIERVLHAERDDSPPLKDESQKAAAPCIRGRGLPASGF